MKLRAIVVGIMLLAAAVFGQGQPQFSITVSPYLNATLTNTDSTIVYVLFPDGNGTWYISETLPTNLYAAGNPRSTRWWMSGDAYLFLEPNASTGMAANETDSLTAYIQPLVWDEADAEYAIVDVDKTYLVFDTINDYTAASYDWLDWTTGQEYGAVLTGELCPVSGFALSLVQKNSTSGIGIHTVAVYFSRQSR